MAEGSYDIFTMDNDGGNLSRLTNEGTYFHKSTFTPDYSLNVYDASPRFSPDGSKITFMSYFKNHGYDIFIMDADGKNQTRLTNIEGYNVAPHFTPDGTKIIFRTHRNYDYDIYVMNLDGSNQTNLTPVSDHAYFSQFSPDGSKILFYDSEIFNKYKIYIMDEDGKNKIKLTNSSFYYNDLFPNFQP
jgi:Tol biopolymer transport system component